MKKTYLIEYSVFDKQHKIKLANKTMRVKNQENEMYAKVNLEKHLKKQYSDFGSMIIHKCNVDNDILSQFNDLFGGFKK